MKRKKVFLLLCLLFLLWVTYECSAEELSPVFSKTCYWVKGALSYPFRCEKYEFKEHVYWVGWNQGHVFRIEEETPLGSVILWTSPFVYEVEA